MSESNPDLSELSSGQWCELHGFHQDHPAHDYRYPDCERHLRNATPAEEATLLRVLANTGESA